jgi:hypothetical protein
MSKKEVDFDKEVERLARKTNVNLRKAEYSFDNRLKRLDSDIDNIMNKKIKEFDENKNMTSKYLMTGYKQDTIDRYREKLKKI